MADRGGAERVLDQSESDILANIQQAILNGSRCFETDDVDGSGILMELRQSLRNLQILHIFPARSACAVFISGALIIHKYQKS